MNKSRSILFNLGLVLASTFCNAYAAPAQALQSQKTTPISTLLASGFCGNPQESVRLITTQEQWTALIASQSRSPRKPQIPEVDFQRFAVLYISMGTQKSSGYGLFYDPSETVIDQHQGRISVVKTSPNPNRMSAQVMTKPCLALKIDTSSVEQIELNFNQTKQTLILTGN